MNAKQTTINRLLQSSNSNPDEVKRLEGEIVCSGAFGTHRQDSQKSHEYYTEACTQCASEWKEITTLDDKPYFSHKSTKINITKKQILCCD